MDRGAWRAKVYGVARVGHDLAAKERECKKPWVPMNPWGWRDGAR